MEATLGAPHWEGRRGGATVERYRRGALALTVTMVGPGFQQG
jgi:hypothetical protein